MSDSNIKENNHCFFIGLQIGMVKPVNKNLESFGIVPFVATPLSMDNPLIGSIVAKGRNNQTIVLIRNHKLYKKCD